MAEKVIRAAIRIVSWRTFHSTFGFCGLFQQLANSALEISRFVMRINAAIQRFTYDFQTRLQLLSIWGRVIEAVGRGRS